MNYRELVEKLSSIELGEETPAIGTTSSNIAPKPGEEIAAAKEAEANTVKPTIIPGQQPDIGHTSKLPPSMPITPQGATPATPVNSNSQATDLKNQISAMQNALLALRNPQTAAPAPTMQPTTNASVGQQTAIAAQKAATLNTRAKPGEPTSPILEAKKVKIGDKEYDEDSNEAKEALKAENARIERLVTAANQSPQELFKGELWSKLSNERKLQVLSNKTLNSSALAYYKAERDLETLPKDAPAEKREELRARSVKSYEEWSKWKREQDGKKPGASDPAAAAAEQKKKEEAAAAQKKKDEEAAEAKRREDEKGKPAADAPAADAPAKVAPKKWKAGVVGYGQGNKNNPDPKVIELQKKLKALGYTLGEFGPEKDGVDGVFRGATQKALAQFQADNKLTDTSGRAAGKITLPLLDKAAETKKASNTDNAPSSAEIVPVTIATSKLPDGTDLTKGNGDGKGVATGDGKVVATGDGKGVATGDGQTSSISLIDKNANNTMGLRIPGFDANAPRMTAQQLADRRNAEAEAERERIVAAELADKKATQDILDRYMAKGTNKFKWDLKPGEVYIDPKTNKLMQVTQDNRGMAGASVTHRQAPQWSPTNQDVYADHPELVKTLIKTGIWKDPESEEGKAFYNAKDANATSLSNPFGFVKSYTNRAPNELTPSDKGPVSLAEPKAKTGTSPDQAERRPPGAQNESHTVNLDAVVNELLSEDWKETVKKAASDSADTTSDWIRGLNNTISGGQWPKVAAKIQSVLPGSGNYQQELEKELARDAAAEKRSPRAFSAVANTLRNPLQTADDAVRAGVNTLTFGATDKAEALANTLGRKVSGSNLSWEDELASQQDQSTIRSADAEKRSPAASTVGSIAGNAGGVVSGLGAAKLTAQALKQTPSIVRATGVGTAALGGQMYGDQKAGELMYDLDPNNYHTAKYAEKEAPAPSALQKTKEDMSRITTLAGLRK